MLRMVFVADAFVAAAFGIGLVVAPGLVFSMYGLHTDASGEFLARLLGAFVLGWSPLLWWARDQTATPLGLAITRSNAILDTIATVLSVAACLRGVMNGAGWTIVAIFVVFGSVRLYFGFIAPVSASHPTGSAH